MGFRYFVRQRATSLGLRGWVRNRRGGAVEVVAEGPEEDVRKLLAAVREGPPMAWVERVDEAWTEPKGNSIGFDVKHTI